MPEEKDDIQESLPEQTDDIQDSSPEDVEAESSTAEAEEEAKGDVPYERWREVNERMKQAEERASRVERQYYETVNRLQKPDAPARVA